MELPCYLPEGRQCNTLFKICSSHPNYRLWLATAILYDPFQS